MTDSNPGEEPLSDKPLPDAPSPEQLRKEAAKLARRVSQLEATLLGVEQIRDTNARLLDRLRGELEVERARSQELLLNVLPQPIIDRLNAGEGLIADRYDEVAVVFSDLVGFTEISSRLPVANLVTALNGLFSAFDAACAAFRSRRSRRSATPTWRRPGCPERTPSTSRRRPTWPWRCAPRSMPRGRRGRFGSASMPGRSWPA